MSKKNYVVGFHYTEFAKVYVEANNQDEADEMVYKMLEDYGIPNDAKVFDRDYSVDYSEEISND